MQAINWTFVSIIIMLFFTNKTTAQDWPNLERFQAQNEQLTPPAADENRVVFMGNSITEGWLNDSSSFFYTQPAYINRGISGQTTPQMLIRFRQDVIDLNPKVVVILAGINDIAGNTGPSTIDMIEDNLISMAQLAQANGIAVVLSAVLPAADFPWRKGMQPAEKVVELNRRIKAFAEANNMIYLDYFTPMVDENLGLKAAYTYDGVHPNLTGYKVMQPLAEQAIAAALRQ